MAFLNKGRSVAVVEEVSYGAATPVFANSDYIDYTTADISSDIEQLERNVIRDSLLKLESVLGQETSSGSIAVELSGVNTGAVNGQLLYKNGIGRQVASTVATTVATATSATEFTVTSAAGLAVGQVLKVTLGTGAEYVTVATLVGTTVTVTPVLTATPVATDAVQGMLTFTLPKPSDSVASLAVRENLKPTSGSNIDYDYLGVMVSETSFDFPVAGISTASFSIGGAGFTSDATGTTPTLPCTLNVPVVGKNAVLTVGGTSFVAQDVSLSVSTEITDINAITSNGISNKIGVGKAVSGSLRVEYTGVDNFDAFKAGTKAALKLLLRDGGASSPIMFGVFAPSIKFTSVSRTEDGGVLYDTIEFMALAVDCGSVEKALSVFFA